MLNSEDRLQIHVAFKKEDLRGIYDRANIRVLWKILLK
jgi:hypothetical protein